MGRPKAYNSKELSKHLRQMAAEAHDMTADGEIMSRGEALAELLWKKALGYTEKKLDDEGNEKEIVHEPASWAMQMVYERLEGRTPQAITEDDTKIKAAERVRDLAKTRLNALAQKATGNDGPRKGPPRHKPKGDADAE